MPSTAELAGVAAELSDRIMRTRERAVAVQTLRWLRHPGTWNAPVEDPTEAEIDRFIAAMRENPKVVPSFDPDDP